MSFDPILAIISIIFGIIVIVVPDVLGWIVGIFFILLGIWLLFDYMNKGQKKEVQSQQSQDAPPAQGPMEKK
jgi:predicted membrane protein